MTAENPNPNPFVRQQQYPQIVTRTVRGGLVPPEDVPAAAEGEENSPVRVRPTIGPDGQPQVSIWMPAGVAERLNELLALAASAKESGDPAEAERVAQLLHDMREVVDLTKLGIPAPPSDTEREN
jgi:hypothetical protein